MNIRFILVASLACSGCQALFHVESVGPAADGAPGTDAAGDSIDSPNLAFVTSMKIAPGSLGSVDAADAMCSSLAAAANHPGHYVAWLSSSTSRATSRIGAAARGWVRPDGRPFADTLVDIAQGRIWYPLRVTETGQDVATTGVAGDVVVATGTEADGAASIYTCDDYTNASSSRAVGAGLADNAPYGWTSLMGAICSEPARLYCFGIDHIAPVTLTPESTRHAFVTVNDLTSGGGVAAYDQDCATEAMGAALTGTYRAAIATTSQSAMSRFTPGAPWVRADGVTAIDSSGALLAPVLFGPSGGFDVTVAWSGAPSLTQVAPDSASSCGDWTVSASTTLGLTGNITRSGHDAFGGIPNPCNNGLRVYCLQD